MIPYIGDVSRQDALVLQQYAMQSPTVLEFGAGASTQILRRFAPGVVRTVETSPEWIERTKQNLALLDITTPVDFYAYGTDPVDTYDFIFVDGLPELRLDFALKHWSMLRVGGHLAFHDTRRDYDFFIACQLMHANHSEIDNVEFNACASNITLIQKQAPLLYENWNIIEGREPWQFGHAIVDPEIFNRVHHAN